MYTRITFMEVKYICVQCASSLTPLSNLELSKSMFLKI